MPAKLLEVICVKKLIDFDECSPNLILRKKELPFEVDKLLIITKIYKLSACNFGIQD